MKNIERIRKMNSNELAKFLCDQRDCEHCEYLNGKGTSCITVENPFIQWLEQEVEE